MPYVGFTRPEIKDFCPIYELTEDCCDGDFKVKSKKTKYLPQPNSTDLSPENTKRYDQYLQRAIFYNVTKNTFKGLLGQIFAKDPQIELPSVLKHLEKNCDGSGKSLTQISKEAVGILLKNGRFGLLSDYPHVEEELTKDDLDTKNIKTTIKLYKSRDIINWRIDYDGSEIYYTLIVLREKIPFQIDDFEFRFRYRYRVLRINENGDYEVNVYYTNSDSFGSENAMTIYTLSNEDVHIPTDFNGNTFKRIPFEFGGSYNNDSDPDVPPLYDIAVLNIGHYHNSADYEESCFMVGQPTPYFAGLTEEWVKDVLQGQVQLGSRAAVPLPSGGSAGLLQAQPNTMPMEAMKHKEEQFLALGAKLISPSPNKTATQSNIENTSETSILSTIASNCSEAFQNALSHCSKFVSNKEEKFIFEVNDDFVITKMSAPDRAQLLSEWMKGAISFTEYRTNLRDGKVELQDDKIAKAEIDAESLNTPNLDPNAINNPNQTPQNNQNLPQNQNPPSVGK